MGGCPKDYLKLGTYYHLPDESLEDDLDEEENKRGE